MKIGTANSSIPFTTDPVVSARDSPFNFKILLSR